MLLVRKLGVGAEELGKAEGWDGVHCKHTEWRLPSSGLITSSEGRLCAFPFLPFHFFFLYPGEGEDNSICQMLVGAGKSWRVIFLQRSREWNTTITKTIWGQGNENRIFEHLPTTYSGAAICLPRQQPHEVVIIRFPDQLSSERFDYFPRP